MFISIYAHAYIYSIYMLLIYIYIYIYTYCLSPIAYLLLGNFQSLRSCVVQGVESAADHGLCVESPDVDELKEGDLVVRKGKEAIIICIERSQVGTAIHIYVYNYTYIYVYTCTYIVYTYMYM